MNAKELYFVRHGETEWNQLGKVQGSDADIELCDEGIMQAYLTGTYLSTCRTLDGPFDKILSSPMKRAKLTAEIIANELRYDCLNITYVDELTEVRRGKISGMTKDDELFKCINDVTNDASSSITDPIERYALGNIANSYVFNNRVLGSFGDIGTETYDELMRRVHHIIDYVKHSTDRKIIIVSHTGFMDALFKTMFNTNVLPKGQFTGGMNCWIMYCTYDNNVFSLISPPNTEHLIEKW